MGIMLKQLWAALSVFFSAFEATAQMLANLALTGESMSASVLDEERAKRSVQQEALKRQLQAAKDAE